MGFDFILQLFSRLGPRLTREALEKRITAFEHAFWLTNNHDLQPVALDCNWMYCLRQLDTLLFSSAIKSLTEQLPAELVPALRVEAFLLIHNTDKEKQTLNLENIAAQLLSKYAQAGTNKYRYTTGIEIEIDDQYRQIFPIRETAIICALLGLTKAEDASVAFEYAPAPLWRHEQFDPYFRLFEETGFIPGDDICSMHVSAPYDKTWDKEKFEPGLNDLALLTTLLYAPDRRLSRGGTIRDVIRYHNTLILPTGSDTAWQKHMGRVEIRSLAFCKTADHHRQAIKTFNPLYSCLAAFLVKRKDPIEQALSAIWQEFMNKYEELLVPWKIKRDFFHSHAARPNAAIECLQTIKEIRTGDPELREKFKKLLDEYLPRIETVLNSADLPRPVTLPLTETAALCEQAL